jgi:hypothetical protein
MQRLLCVIGLVLVSTPRLALAQSCLHGPDESTTERGRRTAAIAFVQQANAAQAKFERERGTYVPLTDAVSLSTVPVGFVPRLTFDRWSYIVSLKDALDPCGYSLFSDQDGVIYEARPVPKVADESAVATDRSRAEH